MKRINDKPIRVAQIMGKLWAGGVETVVFNYYRAIDKSRYQFDFFYDADSTVDPPNDLIKMGARFIEIPPYQNLLLYLKTIEQYLSDNDYQIVHSHINTLSIFPLLAARKAGIPIRIAHNHSVPGGNEIKRNVLKRILRIFSKVNATAYFSCSEKAGRWMFGNKQFDDGNVFVMKNAINFSDFSQNDEEAVSLKKDLSILDAFVVGHVGRFTYAKNHSFLIDAFKEIASLCPNAKLLLIGDGELHNEISSKIERLGLENRVIMTGRVTDPERYYSVMNILMLPSVFEGLSMTTVEAQAAGKNILISRAIPEEAVISDGCHYMEDNSTPKDWANAALMFANKPITYNKRSCEYVISYASKKLEEKYNNLLENNTSYEES